MKIDLTPLNINQIDNFEDSSELWFGEELATTVSYKKLNTGATAVEDIYDESKNKVYYSPITLNSVVTVDPSPEYLDEMGLTERVDSVFVFMQKELDDKSVVISKDDRITYKSVEYNLTNVREWGQTVKGRNFLVQVTGLKTPLRAQ